MDNLLPCPFCGNKAKLSKPTKYKTSASVYCTGCGIESEYFHGDWFNTPRKKYEKEAIEQAMAFWNTRQIEKQ